MIRNKKGWILACAVLLSIFLTAGCGKKVSDGAGAVDKEYTKGQMALVVITERNRYQNLYTRWQQTQRALPSGKNCWNRLRIF